jgi:hypothetical protein
MQNTPKFVAIIGTLDEPKVSWDDNTFLARSHAPHTLHNITPHIKDIVFSAPGPPFSTQWNGYKYAHVTNLEP